MKSSSLHINDRESSLPHLRRAAARLFLIALGASLSLTAFAPYAQAKPPVPLEEASIIIETNATDCDSGLQFFFDGGPWAEMTVRDPDGQMALHVTAEGSLGEFGLTEQFNESEEPVMAELAAAANAVEKGQCGKAAAETSRSRSPSIYAMHGLARSMHVREASERAIAAKAAAAEAREARRQRRRVQGHRSCGKASRSTTYLSPAGASWRGFSLLAICKKGRRLSLGAELAPNLCSRRRQPAALSLGERSDTDLSYTEQEVGHERDGLCLHQT